MIKYTNDAIAEAAYYIWQNNGCPANSSSHDWNAAMNQLGAMSTLKNASTKLAAAKTVAAKKSAVKAASFKATVLSPVAKKAAPKKSK